MSILNRLSSLLPTVAWPGFSRKRETEIGRRANDENAIRYQYLQMQPDYALRGVIYEIRRMDRTDPRVKKIHDRMAKNSTSGGLRLEWSSSENPEVRRRWLAFERRCGLDRQAKLESDARGLVMEGNLFMQWVVDEGGKVAAALRMPTETMRVQVNEMGRFMDASAAFCQYDQNLSQQIAVFPLWQMTLERLSPDSIDDQGALGRPYLDSTRTVWRQLRMTEEDLVIRRRQRAPLRFAHTLEGATAADLATYKNEVEQQQRADSVCTDFYLNRKGGVVALQGDANLDQVADVAHLLDTFFAGSPAPKALFGYAAGLNRDILEDLKRDYYEEIDSLQDTLSWVYEQGFRLELLLAGINPDAESFYIRFAERMTETANQAADRALKYQALGVPSELLWEEAGLEPATVQAALDKQALAANPYPNPGEITPAPNQPRVSITPGNAPKGESATSITNGIAA